MLLCNIILYIIMHYLVLYFIISCFIIITSLRKKIIKHKKDFSHSSLLLCTIFFAKLNMYLYINMLYHIFGVIIMFY